MSEQELNNPEWLDDVIDHLESKHYFDIFVSTILLTNQGYEITCSFYGDQGTQSRELYVFKDNIAFDRWTILDKEYVYILKKSLSKNFNHLICGRTIKWITETRTYW